MYIYDISGPPRLEKILTASDRTILSVAWNPHDPNSIAMAIAEEEHNLLVWDLHAEAVSKRLSAVAQPAKFISWCARAAHHCYRHQHRHRHHQCQLQGHRSPLTAPRGGQR